MPRLITVRGLPTDTRRQINSILLHENDGVLGDMLHGSTINHVSSFIPSAQL